MRLVEFVICDGRWIEWAQMLPALVFLFTTTALGVWLAARLSTPRGLAERLGVGLAIGLMIQLWLPFLTSKSLGMGGGPHAALGISVLGLAVWWSLGRDEGEGPDWRGLCRQVLERMRSRNGLFLSVMALFLGWLCFTHSLQPREQGLCSAGVAWEDQSYHAMLASSFLWSENLQAMEYPHYTGWPLGYPFLADLLAATLARLGASLGQAFWWSAWYALATFLLLAWSLVRLWLGSATRASVAMVLFFCASGLGWVDFIQEMIQGTPWPEMLMKHDYVNGWELGLHYENPLTGVLLPMRTSLIGMPVALAILLIFTRLSERREAMRGDLVAAGLLAGLLPLVHAHSFLVVGLCGAVYALFFFPRGEWWRLGLWFAAPMLALALPQLLWTRGQLVISDPFIRVHFGWMCDAKTVGGYLSYWWHNGGARLPLGLACWFFAPAHLRKLTAPLLLWLLIGNVMLFQPFAYDNIKFFIFADLALAALTMPLLGWLWARPWKVRWVTLPLVLLLTAAGLLSIWRELRLCSTIADWEAVRFAEVVRANTPPRAVFLTGNELNHPVPVLTGRPLVLGYKGWLVQHGVPIAERERDVKAIFEGSGNVRELLAKYQVRYVVVGPPEHREYPALKEEVFAGLARVTFRSGAYTLYELQP